MSLLDLHYRRRVTGWTAPTLFILAFLFLIGQAVLVVLWVDVPNLRETTTAGIRGLARDTPMAEVAAATSVSDDRLDRVAIGLLLVLWPLFIVESIYHWVTRPWNRTTAWFHFYGLLFCLCPSLRMCARSPEMDERLWLPTLGWRKPDRRLRRHLERLFSVPMILIALLILPVLIVEFFLSQQVSRYGWLRLFVHVGTGVIWFAFAAEFILMVSVAERKLVYIKEHWLDLAIILLPLLSFLRSLQVARASRLFRIGRIPQVTKVARVYRLRGTALRAFRALIVLEVIQRLMVRNPTKMIERMEKRQKELEREARLLRRKILQLKREQNDDPAGSDERSRGSGG